MLRMGKRFTQQQKNDRVEEILIEVFEKTHSIYVKKINFIVDLFY
jgi:hypothetical protein